jgi:hypothetical protein
MFVTFFAICSCTQDRFVTGDKYMVRIQLCTATLVLLTKRIPGLQKRVPYPPCTVTIFWLKYQDSGRMLRRVTQPPFIAGPLYLSH